MPETEIEIADAEKYVGGKYLCKKKLGSGGFGEVWSCVDVIAKQNSQNKGTFKEGDNQFAMKIENLVEPSEKEKAAGVTKKQPVPIS